MFVVYIPKNYALLDGYCEQFKLYLDKSGKLKNDFIYNKYAIYPIHHKRIVYLGRNSSKSLQVFTDDDLLLNWGTYTKTKIRLSVVYIFSFFHGWNRVIELNMYVGWSEVNADSITR